MAPAEASGGAAGNEAQQHLQLFALFAQLQQDGGCVAPCVRPHDQLEGTPGAIPQI